MLSSCDECPAGETLCVQWLTPPVSYGSLVPVAITTSQGAKMRSFIEAEQTYSGSAKGVHISRDRAVREMRDHGITDYPSIEEGLAEAHMSGETFSASRLLEWLGY